MKKSILIVLVLGTGINELIAQPDIFGKWKTIDDESNKPRSIVEIYKKDRQVFGKIIQLFREPEEDQNPLCEECEGSKYNQPVIGMEIITEMNPRGDHWGGGEILDPENGNVYRCKLWLEEGKLKVRGYLFFLYRTQTWVKES